MKKLLAIVLCVVMSVALFAACAPSAEEVDAAAEEVAEEVVAEAVAEAVVEEAVEEAVEEVAAEGEVIKLDIGFYADAADSYYQVVNDSLAGLAASDPMCDWTIDYIPGDGTADMQLRTVENFITSGYDAIIVIQNNVQTTSECIALAADAGIPYFGAGHDFSSAENAADAAGSINFDFVQAGVYAGEDAASRGVSKVVMIEGVLGQGSAGAQTLGFLQAYEDAGMSLGGATAEDIAANKTEVELDGTQDVEIVTWASGNWFKGDAQEVMADAITALGPDGFDGVYVQNNPMAEGAIAAIQDAGLNPADYWIGSSNGREYSWDWAEDGTITMDVNQSPALEGAVLYQQIKSYFMGEDYKKYVRPYLNMYNVDNIAEVRSSLVPVEDLDAFFEGAASGAFVIDLNDPMFVEFR